jgi:hypothetical protein
LIFPEKLDSGSKEVPLYNFYPISVKFLTIYGNALFSKSWRLNPLNKEDIEEVVHSEPGKK